MYVHPQICWQVKIQVIFEHVCTLTRARCPKNFIYFIRKDSRVITSINIQTKTNTDEQTDTKTHTQREGHKDTHRERDTTENTIDVAAVVVYCNRKLTTRLKINFHRANCNPHVQQVSSKPSSKQPLNNFRGDTHLDIQIGDHSLRSKMSRHSVSSQWSCQ